MKKISTLVLFLFIQNLIAQKTQPFEFDKIYSYVLQGDVTKILSILDTLPDERLSSDEKKIKEKYFKRFKHQEEKIDYNTNNTILQDVLKIYQTYWKKALLDKANMKKHEAELRKSVTSFLNINNYPIQHDYVDDTLILESIENNFNQHLKNFLSQHGYHSATGKTAGLFDLFVWSNQVPIEYKVDLPETEITTTIIFLEDVVTMGWEEYASFGKVYPGGWATKEELYAVGKAYNTATENFKVSYLKHESQHFADYKKYPLLSGADLEYRAKLTELIYAEETLFDLIRSFIRNASSEGRNPHAFGGYAVIRDLSQNIFGKNFVSDIEQWTSISPARIKKESKNLLLAHSAALNEVGPDSVVELIE